MRSGVKPAQNLGYLWVDLGGTLSVIGFSKLKSSPWDLMFTYQEGTWKSYLGWRILRAARLEFSVSELCHNLWQPGWSYGGGCLNRTRGNRVMADSRLGCRLRDWSMKVRQHGWWSPGLSGFLSILCFKKPHLRKMFPFEKSLKLFDYFFLKKYTFLMELPPCVCVC